MHLLLASTFSLCGSNGLPLCDANNIILITSVLNVLQQKQQAWHLGMCALKMTFGAAETAHLNVLNFALR